MANKTSKTTKRKVSNSTKRAVNSFTDDILDRVSSGDNSISKNKTVKKLLKKIPTTIKILGIGLFIIGIISGAFVGKVISKNDTFELVGSNISYNLNQSAIYTDEGVKLISMGRDLSSSVSIEVSEGLINNNDGTFTIEDTSKEDTYYIIYTTTDFKFSKIKKIRYIYVVDMTEQGESIDESNSLGGGNNNE